MFQKLKTLAKTALGSSLAFIGLGSLVTACDDGGNTEKAVSPYTYDELEECGDPSGEEFQSCIEAYRNHEIDYPAYYGPRPSCDYYDDSADIDLICEDYAWVCDEPSYKECMKIYEAEDPCSRGECEPAVYGPAPDDIY